MLVGNDFIIYFGLALVIIFIIIAIIGAIMFLPTILYNRGKYGKFILEHSVLLKNVNKINSKYNFNDVNQTKLKKIYDNKKIYQTLSQKDFLTYQLMYMKKDEVEKIKVVEENRRVDDLYMNEINQILEYGKFDEDIEGFDIGKLIEKEKKMYLELLFKPMLEYSIEVELVLTNMNQKVLNMKRSRFDEKIVKEILGKLSNRENGRYQDESIWDSISKVERAKVSNKMRFAVYKRDGYRCQKCGRKTDDLEIDHIFPISKGGKTEFNNLQTLCHDCNMKKSDIIEAGTYTKINSNSPICPKCGAPLKLKQGQYGHFYGCMNYPSCTYTLKIYQSDKSEN